MNNYIGTRYIDGLVLSEYRSYEESSGDTSHGDENDFVIKRLYVAAEQNEAKEWELVAYIEVETVEIQGDGEDTGDLYPSVEVYRLPFPFDLKLRKQIIRLIAEHPKFFAA